jgi:LCP family protein required for cell wall assembly
MAILVLGIDDNAQADAIRLVRVDFRQQKVAVLSIPRDFYVPIVDMAEHGITQGRINATYGYGEWFNGRGQGIISVANNIEHNFGVTFDHYLVLNFKDIAAYIDGVGGIELLLEQPVADGSRYFSSGLHFMDGETAVGFMRMRYYDTDFARIRRQSMVLRAFYKKAMGELSAVEQTQLAIRALLDRNIQTDFALRDLGPLICLAGLVDRDDVAFVEIPREMHTGFTTASGGNVQIPYAEVVPFIQSVMDGNLNYQNSASKSLNEVNGISFRLSSFQLEERSECKASWKDEVPGAKRSGINLQLKSYHLNSTICPPPLSQ